MTHRARLCSLAFAGLVLLASQSARAIEPTEVADRLKAVLADQQISLAWTDISGDPTNVTLQGVSVGALGQPEKVTIGDVQLSGVGENNGDVTIAKVTAPAYTFSEAGTVVSTSGITVENLVLPAEGDTGPFAGIPLYDRAELESLSIAVQGKPAFSVNDVHIELDVPDDGNGKLGYKVAAEKFTADLSGAPDPKARAVIEALGYQTLNGSLAMNGSWSPSDGRLVLNQYDLAVQDAGTLGMTFDVSGYTPAFIKSLKDIQKKMATSSGQDQSAQGIAMLGLMQQISLNSASIRFEDHSLTSKVLNYVAQQQGVQPSDIVNQAKALLPFGLAQLNNPEFASRVAAAVGEFLDNPRSIAIRAQPAQPLPFAQIMAAGMATPQNLPQVLGVTVTANE